MQVILNLKEAASPKTVWSKGMIFFCTGTGKRDKVRVKLCCTSSYNVIYLISCKLCKEQYVGSAFKINFKRRFRVHNSHVITCKDRCLVAKQFLTKSINDNKVENIEVQLTEQVREGNYNLKKCKL